MTVNRFGAALAALAVAGWFCGAGLGAAARKGDRQKPDFSGRWTFSKGKSRLQAAWAAGMERGVVRIDHREPQFTFERTFTIDGKESRASYTLTTDGNAVETVSGPRTESSRMYWEGDILVLSQRLVGPLGEGTNVVHYRLAEGGRVLLANERTTGPVAYENQWVFERSEPERDVFAFVQAIDEACARQVWPGFRPADSPTAVFDGTRTVLFRHPSPPTGRGMACSRPVASGEFRRANTGGSFMRHALIAIGAAVLLSAPTVAQAPQAKPAPTLESLAGRYQGTATTHQGEETVTAELRFVDGRLVGNLTSDGQPIAVVGATITRDRLVLNLDMGGTPGTITAVVKDGRIDGDWELAGMTGKCVLTRMSGDATQTPVKPPPFATHPRLEVVVPDFPAQGLILDIGGGGEGVIGQLKGRQVVAIDLLKRELDEAPGQPLLKIVMDARELKFVDATFPTATVFFTFMYIDPADHEKVFREIHRVLEPGGRMLVWDVTFPEKRDPGVANIMYPLHVKLPTTDINTGYGVRFREGQGADQFVGVAGKAGFQVVSRRNEAGWFFLELRKAK